MGTIDAWLGCWESVCDLRMCPSFHNRHQDFNECIGEVFQIIGEGPNAAPIRVGQRIRFRYLYKHNTWIGCHQGRDRCEQNTCPGSTIQGKDFSRCTSEIFRMYARGKKNGDVIHSGDVVMLYHVQNGIPRYVSIQGKKSYDDTSLNFCPGLAPPAYLSYGICSKNVFRIYRKP